MVFRKPYAFFIKNFKKIHILLIVLCGFIYSRTIQVSEFNKDFLTYLSYDSYFEPISKYLSVFLYFSVFLVIIGFLILAIVLRRKSKPWKIYLLPVVEYILLLIIFIYITNFYNTYDGSFSTTTMRALNNFLSIATFPQYLVFLVLIVRILGLDIKKFNFSADEEFLELDPDDREEFEVSINFDKYSIKRVIKRNIRELGYFYQEHKFICNICITIISVFTLYKTYYYFGVSHKTIKENQVFNVNNYSMIINKSYYTDKDMSGNILEKDSAFVILNLSVLNNGSSRKFDGNDFHIVNRNHNYTFQGNTYSKYFSDLGNSFPTGKLKNGEQKNFALIFKVKKDLDYKDFIVYYQEYKGRTSYLRKIKLNLENVAEIKEVAQKKVTEKLEVKEADGDEVEFTFESVNLQDSANYNIETCDADDNCNIITRQVKAKANNKLLYIEFSSPDYEGEELTTFSINHGKIKYIDNDGLAREVKVNNSIPKNGYLGKYMCISVPSSLEQAKEIEFIYTVRNKKYSYKIR